MKQNLPRVTVFLIAVALVVVAGLMACTPEPTPAPSPTVTITAPASGATILPGSVTVAVQVTNFSIASKLGQPNVAGEGHIHYYLDAEPPTTPGQPAVTDPGTYAAASETSYTWQDVMPGSHTLGVQLVNNNHTPLEPPVVAKVTVNIETSSPAPEPSPTLKILSPAPGATLPAGPVTLTIEVSDFSITSKLGQPNVAGEGHIHYYLDAEPPTTPGQPAVTDPGTYAAAPETSYTWQDVMPGSHTLGVQLVNNNHTPLEPPVVAKVTVNVSGSAGPVSINLSAQNVAFDKSRITVPPGAMVTIVFTNKDSGIPHNFALYDTPSANTSIFVGEIISGVRTIEYEFVAPTTPGTYFFRCDIHPGIMNGDFVVGEQEASSGGNGSRPSDDGSSGY